MLRLVHVWLAGLLLFDSAYSCVAAEDVATIDPRALATATIRQYLEARVARLNQHEPANAATLDQWQRIRPALRRQLFDMLGLEPLPPRGDLKAVVTGQVEREGVVVEKLHFQSIPGLYVTANFYRPREVSGRLPTILYLNGHARAVEADISLGNKVSYQHHGTWFAKNGYCCLSIDTLQLGEIEGVHHGTYRLGQWWWIARGYTPAGVEAWNAIRALDYLESRAEVDMSKIGVTGRSGGGAYSWWVTALDDRPACIVPVAGITDLEDHVVHDCVQGHCDCMYHVNRQGWDFATIACLAAPRPCLLANSDKDNIFPLGGVVRIHEKMRRIYALYGEAKNLGLFISEGPHADTQELQVAAFRWMNRFLRGTTDPITAVGEKPFPPPELKVFAELPADQRNTTIQESFVPAADPGPPPATLAAWDARRADLLASLRRRCFGGISASGPLEPQIVADQSADQQRLRIIEYASDDGLRFAVLLITPADDAPIERITLEVADDAAWQRWVQHHGAAFSAALASCVGPIPAESPADQSALSTVTSGEARGIIAPRGWGPNAWTGDEKARTHLARRFVLAGTTVDEGRIFDVRRAILALRELLAPEAQITLAGKGPAAGIALYAAVLEPGIAAVELEDPPTSHRQGPILIDVLRVLDLPQALALVFPRRVTLQVADGGPWSWSEAVAKLYGETPPLAIEENIQQAK